MPKRKSGSLDTLDLVDRTVKEKKKKKTSVNPAQAGNGVAMPAAYTAQQKQAIAEFQSVTQSDKSSAAKMLKQHAWNISAAMNGYFSNPTNATSNPSRTTLSRLFDSYREDPKDSPDELNFEGTGKLLGDLSIELDDVGSLVVFELVSSPQLGRITREGFVDGFSEANVDSIPKARTYVLGRRSQLSQDRKLFKEVYNHTFALLLEERKKSVDLEQAEGFWRLLFSPVGIEWRTNTTPWLEWWLEFLNDKWGKAINKDLWRQTLSFAEQTIKDDSLSFWNEESSWPSVIDEFVEWVRTEKRPGGGDQMEVE